MKNESIFPPTPGAIPTSTEKPRCSGIPRAREYGRRRLPAERAAQHEAVIGCLVVGGLAAGLLKAEGEGRPEPEARAHAAGLAAPVRQPTRIRGHDAVPAKRAHAQLRLETAGRISPRRGACGATAEIPAGSSRSTRSRSASGFCQTMSSGGWTGLLAETLAVVTAVRLLMPTGCRLNEVQTLRWEDVDPAAGELRLRDRKTGARMVPLSKAAASAPSALPRNPETPWVIVGRKPDAHLTDLQHPLRRIRARARLDDVRIHDLWHTIASHAVMSGGNLPLVGKLLGHRRHRTTAGYAHLADRHLVEAAERIGRSIAKAMAGDGPSDSAKLATRRNVFKLGLSGD